MGEHSTLLSQLILGPAFLGKNHYPGEESAGGCCCVSDPSPLNLPDLASVPCNLLIPASFTPRAVLPGTRGCAGNSQGRWYLFPAAFLLFHLPFSPLVLQGTEPTTLSSLWCSLYFHYPPLCLSLLHSPGCTRHRQSPAVNKGSEHNVETWRFLGCPSAPSSKHKQVPLL